MKKIKRINATKSALSIGILVVILSFINGILYLLNFNIADVTGVNIVQGFLTGFYGVDQTNASFWVVLIMAPIIEGFFYFLITWIVCLIYNIIAKRYPIELDI